MNTQNILKYWGNNLDISLDMSEFYDFTLDLRYDEMDHVDLVLDYSEFYDFELVHGYEINERLV